MESTRIGFLFLKCSDKTSYPIFHEPKTGARTTKLKMKPDLKGVWPGLNLFNFINLHQEHSLYFGFLEHEYAVDFGKEPFRFIHWNIQAVPKEMAKDVLKKKIYSYPSSHIKRPSSFYCKLFFNAKTSL